MEKEYYYIDEYGEQFGPYSLEIFRLLPLRGETLVWHTGMGEWTAADTMEELKGFLRKESPAPDTVTPANDQVESIPTTVQTSLPGRPMPKSWMTESILLTLLCSIIGLIPFFHAMQVRNLYQRGDFEGAERESATAKKWFYIALAIGLVVDTLYLLFFRDYFPNTLP
ncbi:CD225/dispanin family protein [uncultured Porphyromonas sp.]|uniref:CD225/dispanin family protein n=1 Tax=uncultured Porphyromonas sp. TaxID=159274 RepID=UPI0026372697|nr:CD225/dispanin family protein [uncultured Porphyromonas sp.]